MKRDSLILMKIIEYASEIAAAINRFDLDYDKFTKDTFTKGGIVFFILQIGELANKLSDETTQKYNEVPWRHIAGMRNRIAHGYDTTDEEIVWAVATSEIPKLKLHCEKMLKEIES